MVGFHENEQQNYSLESAFQKFYFFYGLNLIVVSF